MAFFVIVSYFKSTAKLTDDVLKNRKPTPLVNARPLAVSSDVHKTVLQFLHEPMRDRNPALLLSKEHAFDLLI